MTNSVLASRNNRSTDWNNVLQIQCLLIKDFFLFYSYAIIKIGEKNE